MGEATMTFMKIILLICLAVFGIGMFATWTNAGWTAAGIAAVIFILALVAKADGADEPGYSSPPMNISTTNYSTYVGGTEEGVKECYAHYERYWENGLWHTRTTYNPAWKILSTEAQNLTPEDYNDFYNAFWEGHDQVEDYRRERDGEPPLEPHTDHRADYLIWKWEQDHGQK
jgi:hypothetical protein